MGSRQSEGAEGESPPGNGGGRRRYVPQSILYREPLEAMAAVCAPAPPAKGNPGFCPQGPVSS